MQTVRRTQAAGIAGQPLFAWDWKPRRLAFLFWVCTYVVLTLIAELRPDVQMTLFDATRLSSTFIGAVLYWATLHLPPLSGDRSERRHAGILAAGILAAPILLWSARVGIDALSVGDPLRPSQDARWVLIWSGYFLTWVAGSLMLRHQSYLSQAYSSHSSTESETVGRQSEVEWSARANSRDAGLAFEGNESQRLSARVDQLTAGPKARVEMHLQALGSSSAARFSSSKLDTLYRAALACPGGTFLELGTDRGRATNSILSACEEVGGSLVSVDIQDCSKAAASKNWTFVQADSTDRKGVTNAAPVLLKGIDFIYVDSLHTPEHVKNELYEWFDLVKEGGSIFFDDVDPGPYLKGARKDNPVMEIANRRIREIVEHIFYSNPEDMDLSVTYGSTGLAIVRKRSPFGRPPGPLLPAHKARTNLWLAKLADRVGRIRYRHGDNRT